MTTTLPRHNKEYPLIKCICTKFVQKDLNMTFVLFILVRTPMVDQKTTNEEADFDDGWMNVLSFVQKKFSSFSKKNSLNKSGKPINRDEISSMYLYSTYGILYSSKSSHFSSSRMMKSLQLNQFWWQIRERCIYRCAHNKVRAMHLFVFSFVSMLLWNR